MPPAGAQGAAVKPDPKPSENPPETPTAKDDSAAAKSEREPGLYVIVAETREGRRLVELHDELAAESRYAELTYANRQQRRRHDDDDDEFTLAEGGGSYEIDAKNVTVYKLGASVHKFS